ncbi:MAG: VCBS repeat-containing protein [Bacteroidota bacterium]
MKISVFFLLVCLFLFLSQCQQNESKKDPQADMAEAQALMAELSGEELAKIHCGSCHKFPEPAVLDKPTWSTYILPRMGYMLGIYPDAQTRASLFEDGPGGTIVAKEKIYPAEPIIIPEIWEKIQSYYLENAPEALELPQRQTIAEELPHFKVTKPPFSLSPPSVTMANFMEDGTLFIGDANTKALYKLDEQFKLDNAANVREGAVWIQEGDDNYFVTVMGSFSPTDAPSGLLLDLPKNGDRNTKVLLQNLQRPVHTEVDDLNGDGRQDIVTCEFAKWTGQLSWWEQTPEGAYKKNILKDQPGAIKSYILDFNKDGNKDIVALFGQGNEGIWVFYNDGKGQFTEKQLIQFESSYGSSYFNFFDYNGDGLPDIIYTAGDNADYQPVLKPYHGIRIFENKGNEQFEEVFFYYLNGAYNAIPADFDLDGDLDIAAISFFPDFVNHPEEAFVYLQNDGQGNYEASSFEEVSDGRWIVMDANDYDKDGDLDLVLGSLAFEVIPPMGLVDKWIDNGLPFIILENTTK